MPVFVHIMGWGECPRGTKTKLTWIDTVTSQVPAEFVSPGAIEPFTGAFHFIQRTLRVCLASWRLPDLRPQNEAVKGRCFYVK